MSEKNREIGLPPPISAEKLALSFNRDLAAAIPSVTLRGDSKSKANLSVPHRSLLHRASSCQIIFHEKFENLKTGKHQIPLIYLAAFRQGGFFFYVTCQYEYSISYSSSTFFLVLF